MPWSAHIDAKGVVAIHAALQPGGSSWEEGADTDGVIVLWGGDNHNKSNHDAGKWDHAAVFNCNSPTFLPVRNIPSPGWDIFCSGHAMMGDGSLLVAGGTEDFPSEAIGEHSIHFTGNRNVARYKISNPPSGFSVRTSMKFEPGQASSGGGRWYPTLVTLANGDIWAFGGHPAATDTRHANTSPETYSRTNNTWTLRPTIGAVPPVAGSLYPRMYLVSDGRIFSYSNIPGIGAAFAVNPTTSQVDVLGDLPNPAYWGFDYPSVLMPLLPSDNYRMRLMLCGTTPQWLELSTAIEDAAVSWRTLARDFSVAAVVRVHSNATLLPDGRVVLTGGAEQDHDDISTGNNPEIFSPTIGTDENGKPYWAFVSVYPGTWTVESDPASLLRNYHSTALLMPDGRIWTAGGNGPGQPNAEADQNVQEQIEIYSPTYPEGPRPSITHCDQSVGYGGLFFVTMAGPIQQNYIVSLMRCGNCTHAWNSGQRSVWCTWDSGRAVGQMIVVAPPNGNVAPPGWWMVFVLDGERRPCTYAKFILLH